MVDHDDDEDIDIKLWTTSAQIGLVSHSQTLFSVLLREQTTRLICFVDVKWNKCLSLINASYLFKSFNAPPGTPKI